MQQTIFNLPMIQRIMTLATHLKTFLVLLMNVSSMKPPIVIMDPQLLDLHIPDITYNTTSPVIDIDFDDASRQWRRNKTSLGNGMFEYKNKTPSVKYETIQTPTLADYQQHRYNLRSVRATMPMPLTSKQEKKTESKETKETKETKKVTEEPTRRRYNLRSRVV